MSEQSFYIALLTVELVIPHAQSLKEKRREIHGLKDRIRQRFNVSVAEVGYQDKWQRSVLATCLVGSDKRLLELEQTWIRTVFEEAANIEITAIAQEWL
ncbi:DUF503 domain-containing protein [Photobacterium sp. SDRW27]|uniref:DUF503 domain-containing protein n=1 Tax=Photobacterium obscurum TaxID=2829490 RepID=UPI002242CDE2|nr:DUF503 domain-containing protein [Photobacterium obscurum]MCW8328473.1 DUF503 domain-containing protein [Photobacterium obscurum]